MAPRLCGSSSMLYVGCLLFYPVALGIALLCLVPTCKASSLSTFWEHELPHTSMPESLLQMESPVSPSFAQKYLSLYKTGRMHTASRHEFCSSAGIYCSQKAVYVRGPQPRVCIPPFFFYSYGQLPCYRSTPGSAVQSSAIFFSQDALAVGHVIQLPDTSNDLKGLKFLPPPLAKALPELNQHNMPELAEFYGVEKGSDMELEMQNTLAHCAYESGHEVMACETSGEGMVSFVAETVGREAVLYTSSALATQEVTVMNVEMVNSVGEKVAACHDMKYPSLLYSCHMTETAQLMDVSLKLADGRVAHVPAVCHMDTSYWNPSHVAFKVLNVEPGKSAVCHWFPENSFIFVQGAAKG